MGDFAHSIGIPNCAGPFILSAAAFILAGLVLFVMLRPDPLIIANIIERYKQEHTYKGQPVTEEIIENKRGDYRWSNRYDTYSTSDGCDYDDDSSSYGTPRSWFK